MSIIKKLNSEGFDFESRTYEQEDSDIVHCIEFSKSTEPVHILGHVEFHSDHTCTYNIRKKRKIDSNMNKVSTINNSHRQLPESLDRIDSFLFPEKEA